jgi:methylmalonyl-CoA mutase C-terminal domain/subunit
MEKGKGIKAIVSMIGLDGHNTGAEVVSKILRDAGMEVVYLGNYQTPGMILQAAVQEDVDIVGISSHASNYAQIEEVVRLLKEKKMNIPVICGGTIPVTQVKNLKAKGIAEVFPPGTTSEAIVDFVVSAVKGSKAA